MAERNGQEIEAPWAATFQFFLKIAFLFFAVCGSSSIISFRD
jgi:hypothetical protein